MPSVSTQTPLVSIIIPTYNYAPYLRESVLSAIGQDYRPVEILVVDDGSTDNTKEIIGELMQQHSEIRYLYQENQGASIARNYGIREAKGEYLALLDADDIWEPSKLTMQMGHLNESFQAVTTFCQNFWSAEIPLEKRHELPSPSVLLHASSALLIEKKAFLEVGNFNSDYSNAEWIEWMARARHAGIKIAEIPEILVQRRVHENNISRKGSGTHLEIIKAQLLRNRRKNS
jgi:glycosyltransferase involved in cell wall biosynthesis